MHTQVCGIAFAKRFDNQPVNKKIAQIYFDQKERGTSGFGFVDIQNGRYERATHEGAIFSKLKMAKSTEILFHHREPTSTANTEKTAHPLFTDNPIYEHSYYLVHNGIISNCDELKNEHWQEYGIKYSTEHLDRKGAMKFNDSESLLHDLALSIEGHESFAAKGSMAFILLQMKKGEPLNLFYGRNTNDLRILKNNRMLVLSSKGYGQSIQSNILYQYSYKENITYMRTLHNISQRVPAHVEDKEEYGSSLCIPPDIDGSMEDIQAYLYELEVAYDVARNMHANAFNQEEKTHYAAEMRYVKECLDKASAKYKEGILIV